MAETMAIVERYREHLENAGLAEFDKVMASTSGQCLRVLPDRENWYLCGNGAGRSHPEGGEGDSPIFASPLRGGPAKIGTVPRGAADGGGASPAALGMYLKKHGNRTWATRIAATLGSAPPPSPGRVEADRALALQSLGVAVMPLVAYGEKLHADGRLESFLLSEELEGYCELQEFIERRFPRGDCPGIRGDEGPKGQKDSSAAKMGLSPSGRRGCRKGKHAALRRLIVQVANIARRFHAAGFNHRDFYCCHFLVKETSPERFDVRLIDLQRVQRRRWFRRRWIVKDLAQLASMSPDDQVGCREKILFLRTYLGVEKLRPQDKRLVRDIMWKSSLIRRRARHRS